MNSEIRYLQMLDEDLSEAARAETARVEARRSGTSEPPRRLPRRGGGRYWGQVAAAVVAVLVLAGSVGFLAQRNGSNSSTDSAGGGDAGQAMPTPGAAPDDAPPRRVSDEDEARYAGLSDGKLTFDSAGAGGNAGADTGFRNNDLVGQVPGAQQDLSKIIRDGRIEVVVPNGDFDQKVTEVSQVARSNGGIVLASSTQDGRAGTFTLRIPARRFDLAMDQLRALGTVKLDQIIGEDVTAEFIDLQARLKILTDRRDLLRALQGEATSSDEILRFASLIDNTQFEIEKIQGNLNFIRDQVAEATIKVSLREQDAPISEEQRPSDVDNPSLSEALDYATQGFLRVLGAVVVGLGYLIPLTVLALLGWLAFRLLRRRDRTGA